MNGFCLMYPLHHLIGYSICFPLIWITGLTHGKLGLYTLEEWSITLLLGIKAIFCCPGKERFGR